MVSLKESLAATLAHLPNVELAVLFGSSARGDATSGSDVDVAVRLFEDTTDSRRLVELELGRACGRTVEIVSLDESPPLLRFEVAREGQVLVERKPHAWADFRARAMVDWWDWAPTLRRIHAAAIARLKERVGLGSR